MGDRYQNGRGVALSDFNDDGKVDIVYGNWNGPHRLYLQETGEKFRDIAGNSEFSVPTPIRTVIAADFDNDGNQELFMNNIAYRGRASNSVHSVVKSRAGREPLIQQRSVGEAEEPEGKGTGGAVVDLDLDGTLELVLSHGESGRQPVTLYKVAEKKGNNFVRVAAMTKSGAPARGKSQLDHRLRMDADKGDRRRQWLPLSDGACGSLWTWQGGPCQARGALPRWSLDDKGPDQRRCEQSHQGQISLRALLAQIGNLWN